MANQQASFMTAIDVGSAKTCILLAEVTDNGLRYRGHGLTDSRGSRKGVIVDLEKAASSIRSEEHTSELQSPDHLVCRLLLEKKNKRPWRSTSRTTTSKKPSLH